MTVPAVKQESTVAGQWNTKIKNQMPSSSLKRLKARDVSINELFFNDGEMPLWSRLEIDGSC